MPPSYSAIDTKDCPRPISEDWPDARKEAAAARLGCVLDGAASRRTRVPYLRDAELNALYEGACFLREALNRSSFAA